MHGDSTNLNDRSSGILLHPTALPGPFGIGDIGARARAWIDTLANAKQTWWQLLPLGTTGYGDSPYQSFSAFAGNPNLLSPEEMERDGLLGRDDWQGETFPDNTVQFETVIPFKKRLLARAWQNYRAGQAPALREPFEEFQREHAAWLDDFALFMSLKEAHGGGSWLGWPEALRLRRADALTEARKRLADEIGMHQFGQFLFFRQWNKIKEYAAERNMRLIGDLPIFVAADSADVWANPQLFQLDQDRRPRVVAGVPPDYFSATGQLWGNPLYDWQALEATGHAWWVARLRATLEQVDLVRLDHFRGFEAYWEVPAGSATAEQGRWVKGPGAELLETLHTALGGLPLIAEDLGVITPEVEALRMRFGLPGMRILQFAFGGAVEERFLPHKYENPTVVYTGTHDNDTTRGWYAQITEQERDFTRRYLARDGNDIAWDFIRLAWSSIADIAIAPLQDVLDLGGEARMNTPGVPWGNWRWRFREEQGVPAVWERLAELTELYGRHTA
ncbi:MAG: 4-alpha-glucanotransferase [Gemmataceae bacterium]|nr:4-alpha-glucanotransferase [Gemmataceae bacterium]